MHSIGITPIFIIQAHGDLYSVRSVALDDDPTIPLNLPADHPGGQMWAIQGDPARWLYLALAGHHFGTGPDTARSDLARSARAHLMAHCGGTRPGGFSLRVAHLVTLHFGPSFQPWLGLRRVGPDGQPIEHDPAYQERKTL